MTQLAASTTNGGANSDSHATPDGSVHVLIIGDAKAPELQAVQHKLPAGAVLVGIGGDQPGLHAFATAAALQQPVPVAPYPAADALPVLSHVGSTLSTGRSPSFFCKKVDSQPTGVLGNLHMQARPCKILQLC